MKAYGGNGSVTPTFFTSTVDGEEWPASRSGRFRESIGLEDGWASKPVRTLLNREELLAHARKRTPAVQPVARRYTD
jgi:hypothetical protein